MAQSQSLRYVTLFTEMTLENVSQCVLRTLACDGYVRLRHLKLLMNYGCVLYFAVELLFARYMYDSKQSFLFVNVFQAYK